MDQKSAFNSELLHPRAEKRLIEGLKSYEEDDKSNGADRPRGSAFDQLAD